MVCSVSLHIDFIMQDPWWDITIGCRNLCHNTPNREGVFLIKNYRFRVAFHEKGGGNYNIYLEFETDLPRYPKNGVT